MRQREMPLPARGTKASVSQLQPLVQRLVAALLDGVDGGEGSGQLALGLGQDRRPGHGEGERLLVVAQADRLLLAAAHVLPVSRLLRPRQQPAGFFLEPIAGHDIEDDAEFASFRRGDAFAGADQVEGQRRADQPAHALRAAPAGNQAELHFGKAQLDLLVRPGQAIIEAQGQFQAAAQARAVDERDRGIR